jgi:hypothetical protein
MGKQEPKQDVRMVDFTAIEVENVEGKMERVDFSKAIGNLVYMNAKDVGEAELGRRIFLDGRVSITRTDKEVVTRHSENFPYISKTGIERAMEFK